MLAKLMVFGVFSLIVVLVLYLARDCSFFRKVKNTPGDVSRRIDNVKKSRRVYIANGPTLLIKTPGAREYYPVKMDKVSIKLGRGRKNDVVIDDPSVDPVQAIISKKIRNGEEIYEFVNLSKINPAYYFNQEQNRYELLGNKCGVALGTNELFYLGETKLHIKCPVLGHKPSGTERVILSSTEKTAEEEVPAAAFESSELPADRDKIPEYANPEVVSDLSRSEAIPAEYQTVEPTCDKKVIEEPVAATVPTIRYERTKRYRA